MLCTHIFSSGVTVGERSHTLESTSLGDRSYSLPPFPPRNRRVTPALVRPSQPRSVQASTGATVRSSLVKLPITPSNVIPRNRWVTPALVRPSQPRSVQASTGATVRASLVKLLITPSNVGQALVRFGEPISAIPKKIRNLQAYWINEFRGRVATLLD